MIYDIKPALVMIDFQNCFMSPGGSFDKLGYDISKYQELIPIAKYAMEKARSLGIQLFYSRAIREKSGVDMLERVHKIIPYKRRERIEKIPLCISGTRDAQIIDELEPEEDDLIVDKRRDSIFQDTELEMWLDSLRVDTLVFAGLDTSICVESSLRDGFNKGWDVILLKDATASLKDKFYNTTIEEVEENFGLVFSTEEFFNRLNPTSDGRFELEVHYD